MLEYSQESNSHFIIQYLLVGVNFGLIYPTRLPKEFF